MNARDVVYGYIMGFNDGINAGGGEGGGGTKHDGDWQKWLDLPNPTIDQAVFLIRITDGGLGCALKTHESGYWELDDGYSIDWGDGSDIEIFKSNVVTASHVYAEAGEYIVTFTNICGKNINSVPSASTNHPLIMAKYGDNIHAETAVNEGTADYALKSQQNLRYIRLSPNTEFNSGFFQDCNSLREIEFSGTISTLYKQMFSKCYVLDFSTLRFGDISEIPDQCFEYCYGLNKIPIPDCTLLGIGAFRYTALKNVSLPNCTSIGKAAFYDCHTLETVAVNNCIEISDGAFSFCYNLSELTVSSECTFGTDCFKYCHCLYPNPDGSTS